MPGMQPATTVATSNLSSSRANNVPADEKSRPTRSACSAVKRARDEEEHAQSHGCRHVGHDAADVGARGQSRHEARDADTGGDRDDRAPVQRRADVREDALDVLRAHRHDDEVGGGRSVGRRGSGAAAARGGEQLRTFGDDVEDDE